MDMVAFSAYVYRRSKCERPCLWWHWCRKSWVDKRIQQHVEDYEKWTSVPTTGNEVEEKLGLGGGSLILCSSLDTKCFTQHVQINYFNYSLLS